MSIDYVETPLGTARLSYDGNKLSELVFVDSDVQQTQASSTAEALRDYFDGDPSALDKIELDLKGTEFQRRVWKRAREIPFGQTMTYGELAAELGSAPRAVGRALGSNRVALVIPCHRIVGANGDLRGYAYGLDRKQSLLLHEQKSAST